MSAAPSLEIQPDLVPLETWDDGSIRVTGTRLHYYLFLHFYKDEHRPEHLREAFPFLSLGTIHVLIGYYLQHQPELDTWLAKIEQDVQEIKASWDEHRPQTELKRRLLDRGAERNATSPDRP